jgi:glycerate 2-kinase
MRILIAPDKFKGTLTAGDAVDAMAAAVRRVHPSWEAVLTPLADGGEGTSELLTLACKGRFQQTSVADPLFRPIGCQYGISPDGTTAFIDLAQASGLTRLAPQERNPMRTTSLGTGELIAHAVGQRVSRIVLGLGGSATMDAGLGILHALGVHFLDENRNMLLPVGDSVGKVEYIDIHNLRFRSDRTELILLHDTSASLLGDNGAEGVMTFARQKGLKEKDYEFLRSSFAHFSNLLEAQYGTNAKTPGLGAAGGAALACSALLPVQLQSGAKWIMDQLHMDALIQDADLILTGEGCIDATSFQGKCLSELLRRAQHQGKQVIAVAGRSTLTPESLQAAGLADTTTLLPPEAGPDQTSPSPYTDLIEATVRLLKGLAPRITGA